MSTGAATDDMFLVPTRGGEWNVWFYRRSIRRGGVTMVDKEQGVADEYVERLRREAARWIEPGEVAQVERISGGRTVETFSLYGEGADPKTFWLGHNELQRRHALGDDS